MKIYTVENLESGYRDEFTSLTEAKKAMREHDAQGFITKVWANGDWEPMGEIKLNGSNRTMCANCRQKKAGY